MPNINDIMKKGIFSSTTFFPRRFLFLKKSKISKVTAKETACPLEKSESKKKEESKDKEEKGEKEEEQE